MDPSRLEAAGGLTKHPACSGRLQVVSNCPAGSSCTAQWHICKRVILRDFIINHWILSATRMSRRSVQRGKKREKGAWNYVSSHREVDWRWTSLEKTYITCLHTTGSQVSSNSGSGQIYGLLASAHIISSRWQTRNWSYNGDLNHMTETININILNCTSDHRGSHLSMISISMAQINQNCSPALIKYVLTILWMFPLFFKIAHVRIAKVQAIHTANKTLWTFDDQEIPLLL